MTGNLIPIPLGGMAKRSHRGPLGSPGRKPENVPPARSAFRLEFATRIRAARESLGLTQAEMCDRLSRAVGYEVKPDDYRKYEGGAKPSFMPLDLLFHFGEITGKTVGTLLAPLPFQSSTSETNHPARPRTSRTGTY